jgi:uncharacterized protein (TIGR02679 family)
LADPLVRLLQANECRPLLECLRKKLERGEPLSGIVRLRRLSDAERCKVAELTGANSRGESFVVDLDSFGKVVCNTGRFESLRKLAELAIGHVIENLREARHLRAAEWGRLWEQARSRVAGCESLFGMLAELRRSGWLSRVSRRDPVAAAATLALALDLLDKLPTDPKPLPIFAAEQTGDAHSLDAGRPLSRLLIRLLAARDDLDVAAGKEIGHENRMFRRRRVWESAGLVPDELSSTALVLNLPATGDSLTDQMLRDHGNAGLPLRLTFRHLRLYRPDFLIGSDLLSNVSNKLFVCENPSVIAAATDRLGARCPPMLCVEGQPSLTCWTLLGLLNAGGYRFRYHGDFDWGGLRIANQVFDRFGFDPWRFSAADHKPTSNDHRELRPPESTARWDPELAASISASGIVIEEESVIEDLLYDLECHAGKGVRSL